MSDEFHRPTYTSVDANNAPTNADGHYNPTQVRLYGIPGQSGLMVRNEALRISIFSTLAKLEVDFKEASDLNDDEWAHFLDQQIEKGTAFLASLKKFKNRSEVDKYVTKNSPLPKFDLEYMVTFDTQTLGPVTLFAAQESLAKKSPKRKMVSAGIMFGYAYEGHAYDFPKPKLMLVPTPPLRRIPADDSGYDAKASEGYKVWVVDKLEQCVEIEIDQGFVEQLVLEANLPGKRSPTMYGAKMALAHRGGRLSD